MMSMSNGSGVVALSQTERPPGGSRSLSTILGDMTEDERQKLLETVVDAHGGLSEVTFRLWRELTTKAPVLKAAIKAEREIFRLKRELQRLDIEDLEQAKRRRALPEVSRGKKAVDVDQLLRKKPRNNEP